METKMIPAIISLLAGLVAVVVTYISGMDFVGILTTLLIVLLSFYVLGCIVKLVLDKFAAEEEEQEEDEGAEQELENIETNVEE